MKRIIETIYNNGAETARKQRYPNHYAEKQRKLLSDDTVQDNDDAQQQQQLPLLDDPRCPMFDWWNYSMGIPDELSSLRLDFTILDATKTPVPRATVPCANGTYRMGIVISAGKAGSK